MEWHLAYLIETNFTMDTNSQSTTAESTQPIDWLQTLIDRHHEMMQQVIAEAERRNTAGNH